MENRKDIIVIGKGIAGTLTALDLAHQYNVLLIIEGDSALPVEDDGLSKTLDTDYINNWWKKTLGIYRRLQVITNTKTIAIEPLTAEPGYQLTVETSGKPWQANGAIIINYSGQPIPGMKQHDQAFIDIDELKFSENTTLDINQLARESLQLRAQGMELIAAIKAKLLPLPPSLTPDDFNRFIHTHLRTEILEAITSHEHRMNRDECIEKLTASALTHLHNNRTNKLTLSATEQVNLFNLASNLCKIIINLPSLHIITASSGNSSELFKQLFIKLLPSNIKVEWVQQSKMNSNFSFKGLTSRQLLTILLDHLCQSMDKPDTNYLNLYHHVLSIIGQPASHLQQATSRFLQNPVNHNLDLTATVSLLTALAASPTHDEMRELTKDWLNKKIEPSTDWKKITEQYKTHPTLSQPPA